jgi:hypothetical protein
MLTVLQNIWFAQSQHETANYSSNVFKKNNNAFGYKRYNGSSYQLGSGLRSTEGDSYASYASVQDSAQEVAAWLGRRKSSFVGVASVEQYVFNLKKAGYFGDKESNYLAGVKKYFNSLGTLVKVGIGLIPLLLIGFIVYKFIL